MYISYLLYVIFFSKKNAHEQYDVIMRMYINMKYQKYDISEFTYSKFYMYMHIMMSFLLFAAYRLYTVMPRLVKFVDQLTNWYVRMNRKRLKVGFICSSPHTLPYIHIHTQQNTETPSRLWVLDLLIMDVVWDIYDMLCVCYREREDQRIVRRLWRHCSQSWWPWSGSWWVNRIFTIRLMVN